MTAVAVVAALFGGFGLFCVYWAVQLWQSGRYPSMLVVLGFAIFAFTVLGTRTVVAMGKVQPRIETCDGATELRPGLVVDRLSVTSALAAFAAMLLYAVCAPFGIAKLPGLPGDQKWFVLASIIGVLLGLPSLWRIAKQRGMGYLRLTGGGVELADAYFRAAHTWDDLTDVSGQQRQASWAHTSGSTHLTTSDGRIRTWASDWYTPGGHAVRELVRFYWQHPERRDELADGRAAERLEQLT